MKNDNSNNNEEGLKRWLSIIKFIALLISFSVVLVILGIVDVKNVDELLSRCLFGYSYDIPYWSVVEIMVITGSVMVGLYAVYQSNQNLSKQLEIEQTPYVVAKGAVFITEPGANGVKYSRNCLYLKNIGRGIASNIKVSTDSENQDKAFFASSQSHVIDLGSNQEGEPWLVDDKNLKSLNEAYIFYYDQLGGEYKTKVIFELAGDRYKVMSNHQEKIKKA